MPRLWTQTIDSHRDAVREATLDAAGRIVDERGITGLTMAGLATEAGIGRATLYKYFPDLDAVLESWHRRQIGRHLEDVERAAAAGSSPEERLALALARYARIRRGVGRHRRAHGGHPDAGMAEGRHLLLAFVRRLVGDAVSGGAVRDDVPAEVLAAAAVHTLDAAAHSSRAADTEVLVGLVFDMLSPRTRRRGRKSVSKDGSHLPDGQL